MEQAEIGWNRIKYGGVCFNQLDQAGSNALYQDGIGLHGLKQACKAGKGWNWLEKAGIGLIILEVG